MNCRRDRLTATLPTNTNSKQPALFADPKVASSNKIPESSSPRAPLRWLGVVGALLLYALVHWIVLRPPAIEGWRETDTQAIARHFTESGANIFYPRIDWGGAGPGYVETEFQLYTWIVSILLKIAGPSAEWPGQLVSLLAVALAAGVTFTQLSRRYGQVAGAFGAVALLSTRAVMQTATSVQPESLCLLLFVIAWFALLNYMGTGRVVSLVVYAVSGALAMLVKPSAGQLGIASFVLLLLQSPELLRKKEIWIAWSFMVVVFTLHLLHARDLYIEYGNTFGVLSGGESKVPRLSHLLNPQLLARSATHSINWGVGIAGAAAFLGALFLKRRALRNLAPVIGLFVGVVAWTLIAMRYTTSDGGNHYHVLGAVMAAEAVACVIASLPPAQWRTWAGASLAALLAFQFMQSYQTRLLTRINPFDAPVVALSRAAEGHVKPGDLIVVRSVHPHYDDFWQGVVQFADPRVFYLTKTRGWPVAKDADDPAELEQAVQRGARFYMEPEPRGPMPKLDAWLDTHATLIASSSLQGRIFALQAP